MVEHVVPALPDVVWNPNVEAGVLIVAENGNATLSLLARSDDPNQRTVVLTFSGVRAARMEPPNDEAISGHRLYDKGLREVLWVGEVLDSELIADIERRTRVHPLRDPDRFAGLRHWVARLKGSVVEVVGRSCEASRR